MSDDTTVHGKPPAHERIANAARAHPWAAITSIVVFIGALVSAWPAFVTVSHYYYTAADAKEYHDVIERRLAWADVGDLRRDAVAARNLVNECRIKRSSKDAAMTPMESRVCDQYEAELVIAQNRFEAAQNKAMKLSGDKEAK